MLQLPEIQGIHPYGAGRKTAVQVVTQAPVMGIFLSTSWDSPGAIFHSMAEELWNMHRAPELITRLDEYLGNLF